MMMKMMISNLTHTRLFAGIGEEETGRLLACLNARVIEYQKNTVIVEEGSPVSAFGILLAGSGRSYKTDLEGRTLTITLLKEGSEIGVLLAASPNSKSPVSVSVNQGSRILFLSHDAMLYGQAKNCSGYGALLSNFMSIVAGKGLVLHERIDCLLRPTAREKIMAYLQNQSAAQGSAAFTVPLDRSAMAEYLNMDRSALSRELSRMKQDKILDFHKSTFRLYPPPSLSLRNFTAL